MAACDHQYRFTLVDIGAQGRQSDGGIFAASTFGKKFAMGTMDIPAPCSVSGSETVLPYVCLGDQAFPLKPYLLRPYPEARRNEVIFEERIYNYRLSRARRVIENTFGLAASVWRILRKPIIADLTTVESIVQAVVCLHNYLLKTDDNAFFHPLMVDSETQDGKIIEGSWRREVPDIGLLRNLEPLNCADTSRLATVTRENFRDFFVHEGAVPWQFLRMYQ